MKDFHKEEEIRTTRVCKTPYNIDFFFLVNTGSKEGDEVQNEGYFKSIEQVRERSQVYVKDKNMIIRQEEPDNISSGLHIWTRLVEVDEVDESKDCNNDSQVKREAIECKLIEQRDVLLKL